MGLSFAPCHAGFWMTVSSSIGSRWYVRHATRTLDMLSCNRSSCQQMQARLDHLGCHEILPAPNDLKKLCNGSPSKMQSSHAPTSEERAWQALVCTHICKTELRKVCGSGGVVRARGSGHALAAHTPFHPGLAPTHTWLAFPGV